MNATNPRSWPLKYKAELICKMEGYNVAMIKKIIKWNLELTLLIGESDDDDGWKYIWELLKHRNQLHDQLRKLVSNRTCEECRVDLNDDDRRWCGNETTICRECKAEQNGFNDAMA